MQLVNKLKFVFKTKNLRSLSTAETLNWLRGLDLNQRPSGYEPDELPDCSTPRSFNRERNLIVLSFVLSSFPFKFVCTSLCSVVFVSLGLNGWL